MNDQQTTELPPPSDNFMESICCAGTPVQDCGLCGRVNFNATGEFMEEGELDELLANEKKCPDKYHGQDGQISFGMLDGIQVVWRCPCNKATRYERFIWNNRSLIIDYLKKRIAENLSKAQIDAKKLSGL